MSKLDGTGESLESILASIRKSLTEQSTDILADDGAPAPVSLDLPDGAVPDEDAPPRFLGNGGGHAPQPPAGIPLADTHTLAGLEDPPPPAPASAALPTLQNGPPPPALATPAQPQAAPQDPLWFLTRPGTTDRNDGISVPAPGGIPSPQPAPSVAQPPAAAPKPALKEIVRGPLPPFFGSSPEAAKVEVAPAPPLSPSPMPEPATPAPLPGGAVIPPPPAAIVRPSEGNPARGGAYDNTLRAPNRPVGPGSPAGSGGAAASEGAPVAKLNSSPMQPTADSGGAAAAGAAPLQGLEAMVAELLRPMLRRWLDENMPRLVSAALKAEADNLSRRDPQKP